LSLRRRALVTLPLTGGLIPVALAALCLALLAFFFPLALLALFLLGRLTRGFPIPLGLALLALIRHSLLRLAAAVLRRLRLRAILSTGAGRALALSGATGLATRLGATARHVLRRCQGNPCHQRGRTE
jgi:hypothetical protein